VELAAPADQKIGIDLKSFQKSENEDGTKGSPAGLLLAFNGL
jgi:hypothetical protein